MLRWFVFFGFLLTVLGIGVAPAAPPDGADPNSPVGQWFQSLKQPGSGASCCSIADCRPVDYRLGSDGYEARLDDRWVKVPDQRVLHGQSNPTARSGRLPLPDQRRDPVLRARQRSVTG